jgi:8-oxo-dGTP pyrophosphatase MutT (NUDIX family)
MVKWLVHSERRIYESPWVNLALTTVEPPGAEPFEHHVIRAPGSAAGCVITRGPRNQQEVLLIFRHRFITDTWGWEVPAGGVDTGETPSNGAVREALEETGWRPTADPTPIIVFHPSNGLSDQTFHIFHCAGAEHVGDPIDLTEASKIEWRPVRDVVDSIRAGEITDGLSLTALTSAITLGILHVQS